MNLRAKQSLFTRYVGMLIVFAYTLGYELTFGDASRMDEKGHVPGSFHYKRLAVDINLFVNGEYKEGDCPEWHDLGEYWKSLDPECTWGGDFTKRDYNHFSFGEGQ